MYKEVASHLGVFDQKDLRKTVPIPANAKTHITIIGIDLHKPSRAMRQKGVYVPAIRTYIIA